MTDSGDTTDLDFSGTRGDLARAALHLFGRYGYAGTSTRAIAQRAGTNVASIAYHFGGKAGLRAACVDFVAQNMAQNFARFDDQPLPATPAEARAALHEVLRAFVGLMVGVPQSQDIVAFITRELSDPGDATERLFTTIFLPRHTRICALWAVATGAPPESDTVKLAVFGLIGQVVYFRLAQPLVMRRMGWDSLGPDQIAQITRQLTDTLDQSLERTTP